MRKTPFPLLCAACLAGLIPAAPVKAAIITVTSATASSSWPGLSLTNTINGSGITGSTATEADLGIATHHNNGGAGDMWHSEIAAASTNMLTWNFAAASTVRTIYYWNHNQNNLTDRGIHETQILYSTNGGSSYQSAGNFNLLRASGSPTERPQVLDLGTPLTGVTNLRFQVVSNFGGIVTGMAEIRFSDIAPVPPKAILTVTATNQIVFNGETTDISWYTERVSSPTIQPDFGAVEDSGTSTVTPASNADTVYTLSGGTTAGPASAGVTVRAIAGGPATFSFVRFTPIKLRNDAGASSIQLAEFRLSNEGVVLDPGVADNPGGSNPDGQEASKVNDNDTTTKWLDFNRAPLVFEYASPVTFDSYSFATGGDAPERDPVRWLIEGSNDGTTWTLIENISTFDYPMTTARGAYTVDIPLPGASVSPALFADGDRKSFAGQSLPIEWESVGATSVTLDSGSGPVALPAFSGTVSVTPVANTTYTFVATGPGGRTTTVVLPVTIISPVVTTINYPDFANAGDELSLIGSASVLADPTRPLPGPAKRLRITPDQGGTGGAAWFRKLQHLSAGFESTFSIHFTTKGSTPGADGMAFIVQNTSRGTLAYPANGAENGLPENALNISFDSYQNDGDPSSAMVKVFSGTTLVTSANLATTPGITFPGSLPGDLTDNSALGAPHSVKVDYVPGDLDVYFDGVLVIDSANVDLAAANALNPGGFGYVGFTSRTGGYYEAHDVTNWLLTEGAPATPLKLISYTINKGIGQATMTWSSADSHSYRITASSDLVTWPAVLASGVAGATGASQTTTTVPFTAGPQLFFRVEQE